jgi:aminoglycoside phosphotransferase (APT) family kinase protein
MGSVALHLAFGRHKVRLNPSDLYLQLISQVLKANIAPELQSAPAKLLLDVLQGCIAELRRRERYTPEFLKAANEEAYAILDEMRRLQPGESREPVVRRTAQTVAELIAENEAVTAEIVAASRALVGAGAADASRVSALLRRAAEWEQSLHVGLLASKDAAATAQVAATTTDMAEALERFISSVHEEGSRIHVRDLRRVEGGTGKQTFLFTLVDAAGREQALVMRKAYGAPLVLKGAFMVEQEFHLLSVVSEQGFLCAKPLWFGKNVPGIDGDFYIMTRLPGQVIASFLGGASHLPEALVLRLAELMAQLHNIELDAFRDYIQKYDAPSLLQETIEQCYRRSISEWRDYSRQIELLPSPTVEYLLDWLERNVPANSHRPVLVHGDFNIHNTLAENGQITGILDWEAANFGAPEQDLAYIRPHISKHIEWRKFVSHYLQAGGRPIDESALDFYMGFAALKVLLGLNRGQLNLQQGRADDARLCMLELGYIPEFIRLALASCAEPGSRP